MAHHLINCKIIKMLKYVAKIANKGLGYILNKDIGHWEREKP